MAMGVNPVFLKTKDIPEASNRTASVLEMCLAAEGTAGQGSIVGAQLIHGLWRVYPATKEARTSLLIKGMRVRNTVMQVANMNPFILRGDSGEEKPTTKVWIDDVPISVAEAEIEHSLVKIGCELRSSIKAERARDTDGKLTRFITGRRFVFITVPTNPLEKKLKVSVFMAKIYHREQKLTKKPPVCSRCLEQNHHVSQCDRDVVCRACKMSGHKKGDPACQIPLSVVPPPQQDSESVADTRRAEGTSRDSRAAKEDRGRSNLRQTTLNAHKTPPRQRSETPKRRRSKDSASPSEGKDNGKYAKKSEDSTKTPHTADDGVWG